MTTKINQRRPIDLTKKSAGRVAYPIYKKGETEPVQEKIPEFFVPKIAFPVGGISGEEIFPNSVQEIYPEAPTETAIAPVEKIFHKRLKEYIQRFNRKEVPKENCWISDGRSCAKEFMKVMKIDLKTGNMDIQRFLGDIENVKRSNYMFKSSLKHAEMTYALCYISIVDMYCGSFLERSEARKNQLTSDVIAKELFGVDSVEGHLDYFESIGFDAEELEDYGLSNVVHHWIVEDYESRSKLIVEHLERILL